MSRLLIVLAVIAALGGLFVFGLLRGAPDRDVASSQLGREIADFSLPVLPPFRDDWGAELGPSDFEGKPLVINFWASWCGPCRDEAPMLEAAWREHGDRVTLLGVQTQERSVPDGVAFLEEFSLTFPSVHDGDGRAFIDYGGLGVPETYFVDARGRLVSRHIGPLTVEAFEEKLAGILE